MEEIVNIPVEQQLYQHFRCILGHSKRTSNDPEIKAINEKIKFGYTVSNIKSNLLRLILSLLDIRTVEHDENGKTYTMYKLYIFIFPNMFY
jgi:hypothetical protein